MQFVAVPAAEPPAANVSPPAAFLMIRLPTTAGLLIVGDTSVLFDIDTVFVVVTIVVGNLFVAAVRSLLLSVAVTGPNHANKAAFRFAHDNRRKAKATGVDTESRTGNSSASTGTG